MKTKSNKTIYAILTCVILSSTLGSSAFADQPYLSGYGYDGATVYHADKAFFITVFNYKAGGNPTDDVLSVLSMTGSTSGSGTSGVNGVFYQTVSQWDVDQKIYPNDQVWGPNSGKTAIVNLWTAPFVSLCDRSLMTQMTGNPVWSSDRSSVNIAHTCNKSDGSSSSVTNTYTRDTSLDTSNYFLFGKCTGTGCSVNQGTRTIKFYQFGVESPSVTGQFQTKQRNMQFYDSYDFPSNPHSIFLSALPAALIQTDSYIGWYFNNGIGSYVTVYVGGLPYNNVYAQAKNTDGSQPAGTVQWDARSCGGLCQSSGISLW